MAVEEYGFFQELFGNHLIPLFEVTTLIINTQFHPFNAFNKSPVIVIFTQRVLYLGYETISGFRAVLVSQTLFDQIE